MKKHFLKIWTLFILVLTLVPTPPYNGTVETYYDKVAHVIMFGVFSYLYFGVIKSKSRGQKFFASVAVGICFSLLIEFLQMYVPGRDTNHWDFVAGATGVLVFSAVAFFRK